MKKLLKIGLYIFILTVLLGGFVVYCRFNFISTGKGKSMTPTIKSNDVSLGLPSFRYTHNDIITFNCFEKCGHPDAKDKYNSLHKRIIDINENGCYWVEGDNKEKSYDSRDFGWLCPEDIRIQAKTFAVIRNGKLKFIK